MPPWPSSLSMIHEPSCAPIMLEVSNRGVGCRKRSHVRSLSISHRRHASHRMAEKIGPGTGTMRTALLLIAHGSRQEEANADLHFVVEEMRARGSYLAVEAAFLELAEPDIQEGGFRCVARGAERVILLPYFLSA